MARVISMVLLFFTGSFGLALLKNTVVFFTNLTLDSVNFSMDSAELRHPT
jgi:hypothetical protein